MQLGSSLGFWTPGGSLSVMVTDEWYKAGATEASKGAAVKAVRDTRGSAHYWPNPLQVHLTTVNQEG